MAYLLPYVMTKLVYLCPASGLDEVMSCASGGVRGGPPSALRHKQQKSSQQNCVVRESLTIGQQQPVAHHVDRKIV